MTRVANTAKAPTTSRPRRDRGSITVDEILNGALEVAAEVSIDNLSMPTLAKHLDVGVTSIYWYFRKKDDLLDAMTDRSLDQYDFSVPSMSAATWRKALRDHALTMRATFLADPVLADLLLLRARYGGRAVRDAIVKLEQPVAALVDAGLPPEHALHTYSAISLHVRGSVALERLQSKIPAVRPDDEPIDHSVAALQAEDMPLIAAAAGTGRRIGVANAHNFEIILDCILDHADTLIEH